MVGDHVVEFNGGRLTSVTRALICVEMDSRALGWEGEIWMPDTELIGRGGTEVVLPYFRKLGGGNELDGE